jgi:alpha-tubulin suppressor-like RCC1 family protein
MLFSFGSDNNYLELGTNLKNKSKTELINIEFFNDKKILDFQCGCDYSLVLLCLV